jgi:hypothetical protein
MEVAAGPTLVASATAKTGIGETTSCAQVSPGDADIGGGPDRNTGDRKGGADGCDTVRAGDRCDAVGGLGKSGPRMATLVDSTRLAPVAAPDGGDTSGLDDGTRNSPTRHPCRSMNSRSRKEWGGRKWI